jgi:type IV secretory pathway protease TraF
MVKRVTGVPGDTVRGRTLQPNEWWVEGDFAQASTDSRAFGPVDARHLKAKVVAVYWPPDRRHALG